MKDTLIDVIIAFFLIGMFILGFKMMPRAMCIVLAINMVCAFIVVGIVKLAIFLRDKLNK